MFGNSSDDDIRVHMYEWLFGAQVLHLSYHLLSATIIQGQIAIE